MASLRILIRKDKIRTNGDCKLYVLITHNGGKRYIASDIILDSPKQFRSGFVSSRPDANMLNLKIRKLLSKYQEAIDEIEYIDGLTCAELVENIKNINSKKCRTVSSIFNEYISSANLKPASITLYNSLFKSISTFIGGGTIIDKLNHSHVMGFESYCRRALNNSVCTIRAKMILLEKIITYAKRCGYVNYKIDPFIGYSLPTPDIRDAWLSTSQIKKIRDVELKKSTAKCRNIFMLSYYLGGINAVDLVKLNLDDCIKSKKIKYVRTKTENMCKVNKFVEFDLPQEAIDLMKVLRADDGLLNVSAYDRKDNLHYYLIRNIKKLGECAGVKNLIYYSARKSFAQHAFRLGVSTNIIDYILGHKVNKGGTSLYNYISVEPTMATRALRKVLDDLI